MQERALQEVVAAVSSAVMVAVMVAVMAAVMAAVMVTVMAAVIVVVNAAGMVAVMTAALPVEADAGLQAHCLEDDAQEEQALDSVGMGMLAGRPVEMHGCFQLQLKLTAAPVRPPTDVKQGEKGLKIYFPFLLMTLHRYPKFCWACPQRYIGTVCSVDARKLKIYGGVYFLGLA